MATPEEQFTGSARLEKEIRANRRSVGYHVEEEIEERRRVMVGGYGCSRPEEVGV